MASAAKKKQDEKNLQLLKSLVSLQFNKTCFDCSQKGPTYIDLTIGSFVCMGCSGVLRGLNPPHRVKSITMSTFTEDEIEFIRSRGNFFCHEVWLARFNDSNLPNLSIDQAKKDFLSSKYENKRWYVEPSPGLFQEAKTLTDTGLAEIEQANQPQARPGRSFSGSNPVAPTSQTPLHHNGGTNSASKIGQLPMPLYTENSQTARQNSPLQTPQQPQPQQQQQKQQIISLFDDDLETALQKQNVQQQPTPFQQPPQQQQVVAPAFPVNFDNMQPTPFIQATQVSPRSIAQPAANQPIPQPNPIQPATNHSTLMPSSNGHQPPPQQPSSQPSNNGFGFTADFDSAFSKNRSNSTTAQPVIMAPPPDRYRALEELDDLLTLTGSTVVSSGIDWGSAGSAQAKPAVTNAMHQQRQLTAGPSQPSFTSQGGFSASFSASASSDPFNTASTFAAAGMAAPPAYAPAAPFGHALPQPQQPAAAPFGATFGQAPAPLPQSQGFGMQATPFGMTPVLPQSASNPFLAAAQPAAPFGVQPHAQPFPQMVAAQPAFGAVPGGFGAFGAPAATPVQPSPFGAFGTMPPQNAPSAFDSAFGSQMNPPASSNNPFLFN